MTLLIGINLRPAITSVAALLHETTVQFGLSPAWSAALATLPVIAFGVTAPLGPLLARRIGTAAALAVSMGVLAITLVLRVVAPEALLIGTFLAGMAIMAAGTLLPQYLKAQSASGLWVGLSGMSFGVGAAIGASLVVPLFRAAGDSAPIALGAWAVPAVLACIGMVIAMRGGPPPTVSARIRAPRTAAGTVTVLLVTAMFGLQALLYFAVTAYLPKILLERGLDAAEAGWLLAWFSITGLLPTLAMPMIARRRSLLLWCAPAIGALTAAGMVWLLLADGPYLVIVGLLGAVQCGAFGLALALIVQLAVDEETVGAVSSIAQGSGYALAGIGSFLVGVVHDLSGSWALTLGVLAALALAFAVVTLITVRRSPVSLFQPTGSVNV
ncbi:MFS transporter [Microbacterium gorillae]|uniref:MFS transporter n=1 Tax=Microbacterium gorillae TaxID=1231063 RepID=UPI003D957FBB